MTPLNACTLPPALTPTQQQRFQDEAVIRDILTTAKTIAIVGLSSDSEKASNRVAVYLKEKGYRIIPVNPSTQKILGEICYPDLASIPEKIDLVDIFRLPAEMPAIVDQAIAIHAKAVWMQLRLTHIEAAEKALTAGLKVVVDKCTKIEQARMDIGRPLNPPILQPNGFE